MLPACPATDALRIVESTKGKRRTSDFHVSISSSLFDLTFAEAAVESFPTIEWDSDDDFDSFSSLRSLESLVSDDSMSSLGKRSRSDDHSSSSRRLVRSRKIKSGLSSLAIPMSISATS